MRTLANIRAADESLSLPANMDDVLDYDLETEAQLDRRQLLALVDELAEALLEIQAIATPENAEDDEAQFAKMREIAWAALAKVRPMLSTDGGKDIPL